MLRTILFFAWFWSSMFAFTPVCLVFLLLRFIGLRDATSGILTFLISLWARSVMWMSGSRITLEGLERIPPGGRLCYVANHQGNMDIVMMLAFVGRPFGFIAKSQAALVPVINCWIAVIGSVFIDRKSLAKSRRSIEKGVELLKGGQALAIFPEGTRSRRRAMGAFRNGSFKLPTRAEATVVPITMDGTWRIWEERHRITPSDVLLVVHDPIPTSGMSLEGRRALPDRVRSVIESRL